MLSGDLRQELAALWRIAFPLAAAYLAEIAMILTDMAIVGRLGPAELGAVGLAGDIFWQLLLTSAGILSVTGVFIARARARGDESEIRRVFVQGQLLGLTISVAGVAASLYLADILAALGQEKVIVDQAEAYMSGLAWAFPPTLLFFNLRIVAAAFDRAGRVLAVTLAGVAINAVLTYGLVFGAFGLPEMKVAGAGWATAFVSLTMFAALLALLLRDHGLAHLQLAKGLAWPQPGAWRDILRLGLPIGGIEILEHGMFTTAAFLMGLIGVVALAANQIVYIAGSAPLLIAFALGEAAAIRLAHNQGAGRIDQARKAALLAIGLVSLVMAAAAAAYLFAPVFLARLFLGEAAGADEEQVVTLAAELFVIAAVFQLFDGFQAVSSRALRGLGDTLTPMLMAAFGYWVCGVGGGYVLAFPLGLGAHGIWYGMAGGLIVTGSLLVWRLHRKTLR